MKAWQLCPRVTLKLVLIYSSLPAVMSLCKKGLILDRWKTSQALGFGVSTLPGCPAPCCAEAALLSPAFILGCSVVLLRLQCQPRALQSKLPCQQLKLPDCTSPAISHLRKSLQATTEEEKVHAIFSRWVQKKVKGVRGGERRFVSKWKSQLDLPLGNIAGTKSFCVMGVRKFQELFLFRIFFPL